MLKSARFHTSAFEVHLHSAMSVRINHRDANTLYVYMWKRASSGEYCSRKFQNTCRQGKEEPRLTAFGNTALSRMFGPKRTEVTGEWRQLHNDKLHNPQCKLQLPLLNHTPSRRDIGGWRYGSSLVNRGACSLTQRGRLDRGLHGSQGRSGPETRVATTLAQLLGLTFCSHQQTLFRCSKQ
jgi:hypothetical protein